VIRPSSPPARRGPLLLLAVALPLLLITSLTSAQAADAYRYWSYWWGDGGSWTYASSGPADRVLADGDVEGYLFLVSAEATPTQLPGETPDFAALCTGPQEAGKIRVGVIIDYGSEQDSPQGSSIPEGQNPQTNCAILPEGSTGADVLPAIDADVRVENGTVCGISGYPATGCFDVVAADSSPAPSNSADDSTSETSNTTLIGWIFIVALVVLIIYLFTKLVRGRNKSRNK